MWWNYVVCFQETEQTYGSEESQKDSWNNEVRNAWLLSQRQERRRQHHGHL